MMDNTLRVATVQFELRPEPSFDDFAAHVSDVVEKAVEAGASVVVLPELVSMGLLASLPNASKLGAAEMTSAYRQLFPRLADAFHDLVRDLATRHSIWLLGGSHWRASAPDTYVNTAYFAHPDGRVDTQDKLHLTPPEVAIGTSPGQDLLVTSIGSIKTGILVCADIQFPELTRHLVVEEDVRLILCPSLTWNTRGVFRVRYGSHARAVENQIFVVTSTLIGNCGVPSDSPLYAKGRAFATGPIDRVFGANDGVLGSTDHDQEGFALIDLDFGKLTQSRSAPEPPGLSNLRPELYRGLADRTLVRVGEN